MYRFSLLLSLLAGCATVSTAGQGSAPPIEVIGHVTTTCAATGSQPREPVTLRAAGVLDALDTTRTDSSGAFHFRVIPPDDPDETLFVESRGQKAFVRPESNTKDVRVAELTLPCDR
jgi:hypothetical protein